MVSVKVSFVGFPSVGKSTLIKLLSGKKPNLDYKPTMGLDFGSIKLGEHEIKLWDIGGQDQFRPLWDSFMQGSYLAVVVTDSTPQNVLQSKQIVEMIARKNRDTRIIAIANKQDMDGHMQAKRVEDVLHVPTYPMVAIEEENTERVHMILLRELLEATTGGSAEK
ncbi:MAG: ADP-ribosylation factor-like protein [Candidatus Helarchaeota archaeon]